VFLGSHLHLTANDPSQLHSQTNIDSSCQHGRTTVGRRCEYRTYPELLPSADRSSTGGYQQRLSIPRNIQGAQTTLSVYPHEPFLALRGYLRGLAVKHLSEFRAVQRGKTVATLSRDFSLRHDELTNISSTAPEPQMTYWMWCGANFYAVRSSHPESLSRYRICCISSGYTALRSAFSICHWSSGARSTAWLSRISKNYTTVTVRTQTAHALLTPVR
jgi:hypothetical protein